MIWREKEKNPKNLLNKIYIGNSYRKNRDFHKLSYYIRICIRFGVGIQQKQRIRNRILQLSSVVVIRAKSFIGKVPATNF